jgi:protein-S-isoprenylcysteine O-methyltransferase Ste14
LFLILVPGTVAGLVPWLMGGWRVRHPLGLALVVVGVAFLLHAFATFAARGRGTPAPVAPPQRLVVTGAYRYVRNPMYLAVLAVILGQALASGNPWIGLYGALVFAAFVGFVHLHEEPTLRARFGSDYDRYAANVPRWLPRLRPYYSDPGRETWLDS